MNKKDFFEKYNGFYYREWENGKKAILNWCKSSQAWTIKVENNGIQNKTCCYALDGFNFAWKTFQKMIKNK